MAPLTQEYFEHTLDKKLKAQTEQIERKIDEQTEALARIVAAGFEGERKYLDGRFTEVVTLLDVRDRVEAHDKLFRKLEEVLHVKLLNSD